MRILVASMVLAVACSSPSPQPVIDAAQAIDASSAPADAASDAAAPLVDAGMDAVAIAIDAAADCTLAPPAGCAGGLACRLTPDGAHCGPIVRQPGEYQACSDESDCATGQQCVSIGGAPTCRVWCTAATVCDSSRGPRTCIHPTIFTADTSHERVLKTKTKRILKYRDGSHAGRWRLRVTVEQGLVVGWER